MPALIESAVGAVGNTVNSIRPWLERDRRHSTGELGDADKCLKDWEMFEAPIPPHMRVHLGQDSGAEGSQRANGGGTAGQIRDDSAPTAAAADADGELYDP